ncbi:hypothetical protein FRB96_002011 [Tulasnella sp. 330]|nr:hypothetical protein FRB96_002011 [Tulasnella sp. 330]KAG8874058.1 hypothetical protein FRB97_006189 [Tulasnella sp. 331]
MGELITSHTKAVTRITDGKTIISDSPDDTLCLWNAAEGAAVGKVMMGHTGKVTCIAVSRTGKTVVSESEDHTLRLWYSSNGATNKTIWTGHSVTCVAIHPDSKTVVSESISLSSLWDVESGVRVGKISNGHSLGITSVTMSPDGGTVISESYNGTLCIWDSTNGAAVRKLKTRYTTGVTCVALSPDSKVLSSWSSNIHLYLWDLSFEAVVREILISPTVTYNLLGVIGSVRSRGASTGDITINFGLLKVVKDVLEGTSAQDTGHGMRLDAIIKMLVTGVVAGYTGGDKGLLGAIGEELLRVVMANPSSRDIAQPDPTVAALLRVVMTSPISDHIAQLEASAATLLCVVFASPTSSDIARLDPAGPPLLKTARMVPPAVT